MRGVTMTNYNFNLKETDGENISLDSFKGHKKY